MQWFLTIYVIQTHVTSLLNAPLCPQVHSLCPPLWPQPLQRLLPWGLSFPGRLSPQIFIHGTPPHHPLHFFKVSFALIVGLQLKLLRARVALSIDWASQGPLAFLKSCFCNFLHEPSMANLSQIANHTTPLTPLLPVPLPCFHFCSAFTVY